MGEGWDAEGADARIPTRCGLGFALVGTLHLNEQDGLADFVVLREPTVFEGAR